MKEKQMVCAAFTAPAKFEVCVLTQTIKAQGRYIKQLVDDLMEPRLFPTILSAFRKLLTSVEETSSIPYLTPLCVGTVWSVFGS